MTLQTKRVTSLSPSGRYWVFATKTTPKSVTVWFSSWLERGAFEIENEWGDDDARFVIFSVRENFYVDAPVNAKVHEAPASVNRPSDVGVTFKAKLVDLVLPSMLLIGVVGGVLWWGGYQHRKTMAKGWKRRV